MNAYLLDLFVGMTDDGKRVYANIPPNYHGQIIETEWKDDAGECIGYFTPDSLEKVGES